MPDQAKILIITGHLHKNVNITRLFPDACCIPGVNGHIAASLKPYLPGINKVIVCQRNNPDGEKLVQDIHQAMGDKVHRLVWGPDDEPGLDINGLMQAGQDERVRAMIEGAVRVNRPKIEIISLAEIIKINPQISPIAEGIINRREPVIIHAAGGTGKSTLAHQMALELASPKSMYSNNILLETFHIKQTGCQSLFIQSENSMATVNTKSRDCDPDAASKIFFPKIHDDILTTGGAFEEHEFCKLVVNIIHTIEDQTGKSVDLLFVDPLISFNRAEENGAGDMRAALDGITDIMQKTGITPIILHHDRKDGDDYRGSTAINDWCRCRVHLKQKFIGEDRITDLSPDNQPIMRIAKIPAIEMEHAKANNMPLFEPFTMVLSKKLQFVKVADPVDPAIRERGIEVQQALKDIGGFAKANHLLAKALSELTGRSERTCKTDIANAAKHKYIVQEQSKSGNANAYSYRLGSES